MQIYSVSIEPDQIEPILADSKIFFVISYVKVKNFINSSFIDQFSNFFHLDRWKINFRNTQFHFHPSMVRFGQSKCVNVTTFYVL